MLAQTTPVDRIVVVDDASGPEEEATLRSVEGVAEVIRLRRNVGPGGARQIGTDQSGCDLVAYLDADDLWLPTKIERQYQHLIGSGTVAASHTGTIVFDSAGREREFLDVKPLELCLSQQVCRNQVAPPTVLVWRDAVKEVGGWTAGHEFIEDWDLFIRMAKAGLRIVGLREALTRVRRTGHSHLSSSGMAQVRRLMNTIDVHETLVREQLGRNGLARLRSDQMMWHRHRLSRGEKARLFAAAALARTSLPRSTWGWLL